MSREVQSTRMEKELKALREIFDDAALNDDAGRMIQLSRVIIQHEKEIAKQRITEGLMLDVEHLLNHADDVVMVVVDSAKKRMSESDYRLFIDDVLKRIHEVVEMNYGGGSRLLSNPEIRETSDDSADN